MKKLRRGFTKILSLIGFISIISSCAVVENYSNFDDCNRNGYEWQAQISGNNVTFSPLDNDRNCSSVSVIDKGDDGYDIISMHPVNEEDVRYFQNTVAVAPLCLSATQADGPISPVADIAAGAVLAGYAIYDGVDFIGDMLIDLTKHTAKLVHEMSNGSKITIEVEVDQVEEVSAEEVKKDKERRYVLYFKEHSEIPGKFYVGRTSGYGDPGEILRKRDASHHRNSEYGQAMVFGKAYTGYVGRWIVRGGEQWLIQALGGKNSDRCGNKINGVGEFNKKGYLYYMCYKTATGGAVPVEFGIGPLFDAKFIGMYKMVIPAYVLDGISPKDQVEFDNDEKW